MVRIFPAPRPLVFRAWTERQHIRQWLAPHGFDVTHCEGDLRPGGAWRSCLRSPEGIDHWVSGVYREIVPDQKLVFTHAWDGRDGKPGHATLVTVTFADVNDGETRMTFRQEGFKSAESRNGHEGGWGQSFERLRDYLPALLTDPQQTLNRLEHHLAQNTPASSSSTAPFVISRTVDAPRELVWKAWTERDRLMQWFGPKGMPMTTSTLDFRVGGSFHYALRMPDGKELWGKFIYREITPPEKLVWINTFSDPAGGLGRHPLAPDWPQQMLTQVTFTEDAGRTTIRIEWSPFNATEIEAKTFDAGRGSMTMGWTGTFEQLEAYLSHAKA